MKKLPFYLMLLVLLLLSPIVQAPLIQFEVIHVEIKEPKIYPFGITDYVLLSFIAVESNFNQNAVNSVTGARGALQILPIMIEEANRIQRLQGTSIKYKWDDAWCIDKSIEIWYLVQQYHNPHYDMALACQIWFGRGVQYDGMTWREYLQKVHHHLDLLYSSD